MVLLQEAHRSKHSANVLVRKHLVAAACWEKAAMGTHATICTSLAIDAAFVIMLLE
jgi:hypothetical protein